MQPERKLVKEIQKLIADRGGRSFKIQGSDETYQENGIPDLLICYRGIFIGAEVKQPGAKLRPAQRVVLHEIHGAFGIAAVLETVEQAERLLARVDKEVKREAPPRGLVFDRGTLLSNYSIQP